MVFVSLFNRQLSLLLIINDESFVVRGINNKKCLMNCKDLVRLYSPEFEVNSSSSFPPSSFVYALVCYFVACKLMGWEPSLNVFFHSHRLGGKDGMGSRI